MGEEQDVVYSLDSERHRARRVSTLKNVESVLGTYLRLHHWAGMGWWKAAGVGQGW